MAAETLAEAGLRVVVVEQRRSPARKFVLAGRGGLNLTHSEPIDDFLCRYHPCPPQLEASIRAFDPVRLRQWAEGLGQGTFVGSSGRVFPETFNARPLLRGWLARLADQGVEIRTGSPWSGFDAERPDRTASEGPAGGDSFAASVLALGGPTWPRVGSDGGWAAAFEAVGLTVAPWQPANCGVVIDWSSVLSDRFAGSPLKNVVISCGSATSRGDAVITEAGLEGGPIYALATAVRGALMSGPTEPGASLLQINLRPDVNHARLVEQLGDPKPRESTARWLRRAGVTPAEASLLREVTANALPVGADAMASLMRAVPIDVIAQTPLDRAISAAGGVAWAEVDEHFMLRNRPGMFVAGEMLDWEAPTGGYLLQGCFSTGRSAALGVIGWLDHKAR